MESSIPRMGLVIVKFNVTIIIVIFHIVCQNNSKTIFLF